MPEFSVHTQIDIIIAAFALPNYIQQNSADDMLFKELEQDPFYIPLDKLSDEDDNATNHRSSKFKKMTKIRNDIVAQLEMMR
ncbi:hypothetical protein Scep_021620 [Stephania cephalantha]|uniref:Uncharacterized protein n=1 Tax=Stephania cephalantha TaxID=152367 RepID=A0AAP0I1J5_9MAGN